MDNTETTKPNTPKTNHSGLYSLATSTNGLQLIHVFFIALDASAEASGAKIWAVYVSEAEKYDQALVESWKNDMQGILIFVRNYSVV
jgi:hypothetical protein